MSYLRLIRNIILIGLVIFILIQLVPYGKDHTNPPIVQEPAWDSPQTREIASRACFDCHSNETHWPWYTHVAPSSWLVQHDVDEARSWMNFSDWQGMSVERIVTAIEENKMPPVQYKLLHPEARLSDSEKQQLIEGLRATLK